MLSDYKTKQASKSLSIENCTFNVFVPHLVGIFIRLCVCVLLSAFVCSIQSNLGGGLDTGQCRESAESVWWELGSTDLRWWGIRAEWASHVMG